MIYKYVVAPRTGEWIETSAYGQSRANVASLPVRERGLKLKLTTSTSNHLQSLPVRERGLKQYNAYHHEHPFRRSPYGSVD